MSTDRDTTRIVRSWLDEGVTALPDRVLDAVLDQLPATPQRRVTWWPARRLLDMNKALTVGIAAVAVAIVALLGISYLAPGGLNIGGRQEPTAIPTPTPEPRVLIRGAEGPDTFSTEFLSETPIENPVQVVFEMPAGWGAVQPWLIGPTTGQDGSALLFIHVGGLHSDPCLDHTGQPDIPVGSTADELAAALAAHPSYEATVTGETVVDGLQALRMELVMPSDLDYATCQGGEFWVWDAPLLSESANRWDLWLIDVDGTTAVLLADVTTATADSRAQIDQMIESMRLNR